LAGELFGLFAVRGSVALFRGWRWGVDLGDVDHLDLVYAFVVANKVEFPAAGD
jgi:hypothetical protein